MTTTAKPRVKPGVPAGGEFTAHAHKDPSIQLEQLKALKEVFAMTPGTRVKAGNEFGIVSEEPDRNGRMKIKLDTPGSLIANSRDIVPWEAYLDAVMPAVEHNPDPETDDVPQTDTDRALRGSLVRMRNALESSGRSGDTYYQGLALGEAEVAAALLDADADPDTIRDTTGEVLILGLPLGAEHEGLSVSAIKQRTAAPLTMLRARRLAGYFTARAVEMQSHNGAIAQKDWGTAEWTKQGALFAYSQAAVRFAAAFPHNEDSYPEKRFTRLLAEGETNIDTIIGETFDEGAW